MSGSLSSPARRALLSGKFDCQYSQPVYPPWSLATEQFLEKCSQCDRCIDVCPSEILFRHSSGFPEVDFSSGECTFCRQCLDVCPSQALVSQPAPWALKASISEKCLTLSGIACQSCVDMCEVKAITTEFSVTGISTPSLNQELCSGCGACYQVCPADALSFSCQAEPSASELSVRNHQPEYKRIFHEAS
ncbi:ferredoxin-type protein NapF [Endozoicomonas sp. OPT23]|uniref:ferredoxin-type protein NapF n=1 Tax=Endozoicomonas sp. OPT23 TaxID=2072845 RepID=UPI00129A59DC|nr:ferredoxin-type protein NapF [Endozoicomonas sp. OPT23]MRI34775.1 ferredoxin-type protein NapF [Endozoicomonas sp. OPT23]